MDHRSNNVFNKDNVN